MQAHKVVFVLLFAGGLLTSALILPRKQELALMRLQAGQIEQAEALYEDIYRENQLGRSNLMPLTRVYLAQGEVEKVIRVYEIYLKENPDDLVVLEHVARIYRDAERYYDYMLTLEKIIAKKPAADYLQKLVRYQLYYGLVDKAIPILKQLVKINPERQNEFLQLIRLQAHSGDYTGAERSLEQFIQSGHRPNQELAELKLRILLSTDRNQDAFEWAKTWLDRHQDDALHYIALLYSGGFSSSVETAFETSSKIDPDIMPSWLVKAVVSTGWTENKTGFLEQFTARLGEDEKQKFPVIMAKLALIRKDADSLDHWLGVAEQLPDLDVSQQMSLASVYLESGRTGRALSLLSDLIDNQNVPIALFSKAASAILESGDIEKGLGLYRQLKSKHKDRRIQFSWALLASANGQKEVADWLGTGQGSELTRSQWRDIYFAAADRGRNELALNIARRIYTRFGEEVDRRLLAESLLKANLASEALNLVRHHRADSPLLGQLYEQALEAA